MVFAIAIVVQAARVQLFQGGDWARRARGQQFSTAPVPPKRGLILDAGGAPLAESQERLRVSVATSELKEKQRPIVERVLRKAGAKDPSLHALNDPKKKWVEIKETFAPEDISELRDIPAVRTSPVLRRVYSADRSLRPLVGLYDERGVPLDGVELMLNDLLRGDTGRIAVPRDARGRSLESALGPIANRTGGNTVVLTIIRALQEICDRALMEAVDSLKATGGDIVVIDPRTGFVLAMVSRRADPRAIANTALTEPFEPGSTLKPFMAAALLERRRARVDEEIDTHNGIMVRDGRTIKDEHKAARMTLAEVIRKSSNIGIVSFTDRLKPAEKYEVLRDLGFGIATGIPLPGESNGTLREPRLWSKKSAASLPMGYEIAVTALQLASAYGAIANGGELMEPQIVKEVRDPEGKTLYDAKRRVVRRVMRDSVARTMQRILISVVDSGTATKADLHLYALGGKTGTARRTGGGGHGYQKGSYTASFVGLFPGDKPQLVVLVKLDSPQLTIFGGEAAAPVTAVVLKAALSAETAALDPSELATVARRDTTIFHDTGKTSSHGATLAGKAMARTDSPRPRPTPSDSVLDRDRDAGSFVITLPVRSVKAPVVAAPVAVPDVAGMTLRDAVRALHQAGFRVRISPDLTALATAPAAGSQATRGTVIRLGRPRT